MFHYINSKKSKKQQTNKNDKVQTLYLKIFNTTINLGTESNKIMKKKEREKKTQYKNQILLIIFNYIKITDVIFILVARFHSLFFPLKVICI